jgi:hypothetical protein
LAQDASATAQIEDFARTRQRDVGEVDFFFVDDVRLASPWLRVRVAEQSEVVGHANDLGFLTLEAVNGRERDVGEVGGSAPAFKPNDVARKLFRR